MSDIWNQSLKLFISLKLTIVLLALSMVLIFAATLDQVNLGIWAVQEKYFRTFIVLWDIRGIPVPVFPGGYFIGGLLLTNLLVSHIYRFKLSWRKSGIFLIHIGLIVLLIGELLTGIMQREFQMRLDEGETKNYSESFLHNELAIVDITDPEWSDVVAIPERRLAKGDALQHAQLPFQVIARAYFPNASVEMRERMEPEAATASAPMMATQGTGTQIGVIPMAMTYKPNERNLPAAYVELLGPEGTLGTWLVTPMLRAPQSFNFQGRTFQISLRFTRQYKPYSITLLEFSHDRYPGTEIPKNFSSRIRLTEPEASVDREVLIYMNNPLRHDGLTFYQAGFDNNDTTSILQIVRNPGWLLPYVSCILMTAGLLLQFGFHLLGFVSKRRKAATAAADALPATAR